MQHTIDHLFGSATARTLLIAIILSSFIIPSVGSQAQRKLHRAKKPAASTSSVDPALSADSVPDLYSVTTLGSAVLDSATPFPVPIAFLDLKDSLRYRLTVRFPHLGVLGIREDTVARPSFIATNGLRAYRADNPIMQLKFPNIGYAFWIDVYDRTSGKLITSRLMPFSMSMDRYTLASYRYVHQPTSGLGSELMGRTFVPKLLPITLETHPGWLAIESVDARGIYSLRFQDPRDSTNTFLSLTINPVAFRTMDSSLWEEFKDHARVAFGMKGVAVNSLGDFEVLESAAHQVVEHGYEFLSKHADEGIDYVATYITPHAIMLLMAPMDRSVPADKFEFYRAIARSFRLKGDLVPKNQAKIGG